ncbi:hypothetical protein RJT34_08598 [Clitoria ternatea]|uniref:Uncharacterized protein n=1 Tax=Clitoria ternatea TaxID=43366 RepID=A0AAN9K7X5_CLITE
MNDASHAHDRRRHLHNRRQASIPTPNPVTGTLRRVRSEPTLLSTNRRSSPSSAGRLPSFDPLSLSLSRSTLWPSFSLLISSSPSLSLFLTFSLFRLPLLMHSSSFLKFLFFFK